MRFHLRSPTDYGVDRPDLDAPQGVKATGTNRPKQTHAPFFQRVCQQQTQQLINHTAVFASTTQYLTQHQQPDVALSVCRWPIAAGKRPVPIPNPEAKPANADGTATGRLWESKSPPTPNNNKQLNTNNEETVKAQHNCFNGLLLVFPTRVATRSYRRGLLLQGPFVMDQAFAVQRRAYKWDSLTVPLDSQCKAVLLTVFEADDR